MDSRLKPLIEELGVAISESISDSQKIAAVIAMIRGAGYDATIVLNAAIAIKERDPEPLTRLAWINGEVECKFNAQDLKYLKSLHISVNG